MGRAQKRDGGDDQEGRQQRPAHASFDTHTRARRPSFDHALLGSCVLPRICVFLESPWPAGGRVEARVRVGGGSGLGSSTARALAGAIVLVNLAALARERRTVAVALAALWCSETVALYLGGLVPARRRGAILLTAPLGASWVRARGQLIHTKSEDPGGGGGRGRKGYFSACLSLGGM